MTRGETLLDDEVLRILRRHRVVEPGHRLPMRSLEAAWRLAALRHDDLILALVRLEAADHVRYEIRGSHGLVTLRPEGAERLAALTDLPGVLEISMLSEGAGCRRDPSFGRVGHLRRRTDPAETTRSVQI